MSIECPYGVMVIDVPKFLKEAFPAHQFETGQQKGKSVFCTVFFHISKPC